jgi:GMP synthase (glutamine-hydrolysing)
MKGSILIINFGGQYSQLIGRRVRECGICSKIRSNAISKDQVAELCPAGIIFSGGPNSVYDPNALWIDLGILELGIPILGICYGAQLIAKALGGEVSKSRLKEYGSTQLELSSASSLFNGVGRTITCWMSHTDQISALPEGFEATVFSSNCKIAAMENREKNIYALQFHPEVSHTENGREILENFLFGICRCEKNWEISSFAIEKIKEIREIVGKKKIISALSGGLDSSVAALLVQKAVQSQLTCIFVDHGLLRKGEGDEVEQLFKGQFAINLIRVNAKERFLKRLKGVTEPEKKRSIIGDEFIRVFEEESAKIGGVSFLCQGTIYPDVIESGTSQADLIKSHHNVGGLPKNMQFESILEPLRDLFKDEVRQLGLELGLPKFLIARQPFPGPGLAIRIIGEVTEQKLDMLREADAIFREEIASAGLNRVPDQYFAILTGTKSVGVKGDFRTYEDVLALKAVATEDFMTADFVSIPDKTLRKVSARIVNEVEGINRIVLDITTKPPATIEWE